MRSLPSCSLTVSPTFVGDVNIFGAGSEPWFWTTNCHLTSKSGSPFWMISPTNETMRSPEIIDISHHPGPSRFTNRPACGRPEIAAIKGCPQKKTSSASIAMELFSKFCPGGCYKESRVDMARNTGSWRWDPTMGNRYTEWNEEISPIIRNKRNKNTKKKK